MPELPDIVAYVEAIAHRVVGHRLEGIRLANPFLLRTVEPPVGAFPGKRVVSVRRMGKRVVLEVEDDLFAVVHLMIAGRLHWKPADAPIPKRYGQAAFDLASGTLLLTEAGTKRRASLHLVRGAADLAEHDRGGLEVLGSSLDAFAAALGRQSHTVKRALTDPRILSGIGNAYSDEILHRAQLSPAKLRGRLGPDELARLHQACLEVLGEWVERLRREAFGAFPEKVTAFREEMAVHGKFGRPCPVCGSPVQRIVYAANEANYCATCQTGGRLLSDRSLARLLRDDWPRTIEELEERARARGQAGA